MNLEHYASNWDLKGLHKTLETPSSHIYRASQNGVPVVLKLLTPLGKKEEARGAFALAAWGGKGAVKLLAHDASAMLLEYAEGIFLKELCVKGQDDQATEILCRISSQLHSHPGPFPPLPNLHETFRSLLGKPHGLALLEKARGCAQELLRTEQSPVLLHGDLHHKNVIQTKRGWLSLDPKGVIGERAYDFANLFYNPDDQPDLVENPARIRKLARAFSASAGVEEKRILQYAFAFGALSAIWAHEDGLDPGRRLRIVGLLDSVLNP